MLRASLVAHRRARESASGAGLDAESGRRVRVAFAFAALDFVECPIAPHPGTASLINLFQIRKYG